MHDESNEFSFAVHWKVGNNPKPILCESWSENINSFLQFYRLMISISAKVQRRELYFGTDRVEEEGELLDIESAYAGKTICLLIVRFRATKLFDNTSLYSEGKHCIE